MNEGWTNRGSERPIPRQDEPPKRFYEESIPADPACPAWDDPDYVDPEASHADLPLGARYWQGFAKQCTARASEEERRAMSPEWVAHVTSAGGTEEPPASREGGEADPLRGRVLREKETERLSDGPSSFLPG